MRTATFLTSHTAGREDIQDQRDDKAGKAL